MKKNPLAQYRSDLFGSRGVDVGHALEYVDQLAAASSDAVAVQTAARVLLNTVIGAVDQILNSTSPERLALIELIDERINARLAVEFKEQDNLDQVIEDWFNENIDIEDKINDWMSNNFDVTDYNFNDAVDSWMSDNLGDRIADMDLVVRVR